MKKNIYLLALALTAFSCSKDEDEVTVVATWDRNQIGTIASSGEVSNLVNYSHYCPSEKNNWSFTSNGVFKEEELYDYSLLDLAKTTESPTCSINENNGTYAFDGSRLTLTFTDDVTYIVGYEVVSLTATELKLKGPNSNKSARDTQNYYTFTKRNPLGVISF